MRKTLRATAAVAALAMWISLATTTVHAQTVISACLNTSNGTLRIAAPGTQCKKHETLLQWPRTDDDTVSDLTCAAGQTIRFNGTSWECDPPRFEIRHHVGGVQTVFDNQTGLEWEMKVTCGEADLSNPRCKENRYTWSRSIPVSAPPEPDGTLYTDFLAKLNASAGSVSGNASTLNPAGCYAGHCDWRVPNIAELRTILLAPFRCGTNPCIDPVFGPTESNFYWSSTTLGNFTASAWQVFFGDGSVGNTNKILDSPARAVRGGR